MRTLRLCEKEILFFERRTKNEMQSNGALPQQAASSSSPCAETIDGRMAEKILDTREGVF